MPQNINSTHHLPHRHAATAIGCIAIFLWGTLALLSQFAAQFPPFQLLAMCFSFAFLLMLIKWWYCNQSIKDLAKQPLKAWLTGTLGLFLYHVCYFIALAKAPVLEVSLIAYLWPILIILFSALLPSEMLKLKHILGAVVAFAGCWLLLGGSNSQFESHYTEGYLFAAACAVIWSSYSVISRTLPHVPTDAVGLFCGLCALLGWACHLMFETTVWPSNYAVWLAVIALGLGPLGFAFFAWDFGLKQGNIQILGILSYAAPLISTALLIVFTDRQAELQIYIACLAIVCGALIASLNWPKKRLIKV